jgi:lysophospholipase L1-like esterase
MKRVVLVLAAGCIATQVGAQQQIYPCTASSLISSPPAVCYSVEKLARSYEGPALTLHQPGNSVSRAIGFVNDHLDNQAVASFIGAQPYARVGRLNNQSGTATRDAVKGLSEGPRMQLDNRFANSLAIVCEGDQHVGMTFGLDIPNLNGSAGTYTIYAVVRPHSSMARNQASTPGQTARSTLHSLEGAQPLETVATTNGTNVLSMAAASTAMIGMFLQNGDVPNGALVIAAVDGVSVTINHMAVASHADLPTILALPLITGYQNGLNHPGAWATTDNKDLDFVPTDTAVEIAPVVLTFVSGPTRGTRVYQNEIVRSSAAYSVRAEPITNGYLCRMGTSTRRIPVSGTTSAGSKVITSGTAAMQTLPGMGFAEPTGAFPNGAVVESVDAFAGTITMTEPAATTGAASLQFITGGPQSYAGGLWLGAWIYYPGEEHTDAQMSAMRSLLYRRFTDVNPLRSTPAANNLVGLGDSITAGYTAPGMWGMMQQACSRLPKTRCLNYAVAGSTVTDSSSPPWGYNVGMFAPSVGPSLTYSRSGRNGLFLLGGGNDMLLKKGDTPPAAWRFNIAASRIEWNGHGFANGQRINFAPAKGDTLPAPLAYLYVKTYWIVNATANTFQLAMSPGGPAIVLTTPDSGVHSVNVYTMTAASIYAGLKNLKDQALSGISPPATDVYIGTVLPRVGSEYEFIIDDLNTNFIIAKAVSDGFRAVVNLRDVPCLRQNIKPPNLCFSDSVHLTRSGQIAAGNKIYEVVSARYK